MVTSFFAYDSDFKDSATRVEFAEAMLVRNRFLFSQNRGTHHKVSRLMVNGFE